MRIFKPLLTVLFGLLLIAQIAQAATDTEDTPAGQKPEVPDQIKSAPNREDIDQEITNAHLRAQTGAKSLFSLQSTFNYNGSSIKDPFSAVRPQLSTGALVPRYSDLSGSISIKYRLTDHDNLNLGFGVGWIRPLHYGEKGQAENPYFAYTRTFKTGGLQNVFVAQVTAYTDTYSLANDDAANLDLNHTVLVNVGKTKLQIGLNFDVEREFYKQTVNNNLYELAVYPYAEYELSDRYSFRTVYRGFTYDDSTNDTSHFIRQEPTQSLGIGIAITRDIYLYPNLQWVWADIRPEKTNIALAANINI